MFLLLKIALALGLSNAQCIMRWSPVVSNQRLADPIAAVGIYCSEMSEDVQPLLQLEFKQVDGDCLKRNSSPGSSLSTLRKTEMDMYGAGWPCQPWSKSGSMKGCRDKRHLPYA